MFDKVPEDTSKTFKISNILGTIGGGVFSSIEGVVVGISLAVFVYLFLFTPHQIQGRSMYPTYKTNQVVLANKVVYNITEPKLGDVIIFKYSENEDYIKRVIGVPGDTVELIDGYLYLNGTKLNEPYLLNSKVTNEGNVLQEGGKVVVPENSYFVCGDNRPESLDSRAFGVINKSQIKGKVWIRVYPFADFTLITAPDYK